MIDTSNYDGLINQEVSQKGYFLFYNIISLHRLIYNCEG